MQLGKRKHFRGHSVEGLWVIGGLERTEVTKNFVEYGVDRSPATLNEL